MVERWTVIKILKKTTDFFGARQISSPRLDAELLLADTLGLDRVGLYVNFDRPLNSEELDHFRERVRRRARHEPVQYILGKTEFWSLTFKVSKSVLIPRADTEVLVEETLALAGDRKRLLDIGTGSGAIAIALAAERPDFKLMAIDINPEALAVAKANAISHSLDDRILFVQADLANVPTGSFDLVISNPPYIPSEDWELLMPEVRDFEPRLALDGGHDGLEAYRELAAQSTQILAPGGWLLVEVGINQSDAVADLFTKVGLTQIRMRSDYAGIPRVVGGCKVN